MEQSELLRFVAGSLSAQKAEILPGGRSTTMSMSFVKRGSPKKMVAIEPDRLIVSAILPLADAAESHRRLGVSAVVRELVLDAGA